LAECLFHHQRQAARHRAEELVPGPDDFIDREGIVTLRRGRRRRPALGGGQIGAKGNEAQRQGRKAQGGAHWMLHGW
jgi:hypothetical protein